MLKSDRFQQVASYGHRSFYLLMVIRLIDIIKRISHFMVVWVFITMKILNLYCCHHSTLTEWTFISSATVGIYLGV
jgi:hypothetical protein